MNTDDGDIPGGELEPLNVRCKRLLEDRSHFQLILRLIELLNPLPGLDNMLRSMLHNIVECIGGTNIKIYYWIGEELHYLDFLGEKKCLPAVGDPDVTRVVETHLSVERWGKPEEALMLVVSAQDSWNWSFPLLVGEELIGVIKLENMHIRATSMGKYLPIFFSHAALILSHEIRNFIRQRAEKALAESETMYRSLVAAMAEGIVFQAADGTVTAVNPAAERIEGRTARQLIGTTSDDPQWEAIREDGTPSPGVLQPAMITLRTGAPQSNAVMGLRRPDGTLVWISVNSQPLISAGETIPYAAVTTFHDITERKRSEAEVLRLNSELEERVAQRTAALEQANKDLESFSYSVSHDLRAPLRAINGFSRILSEEYDAVLGEEGRRCTETISSNAVRMGQLISDILDFSRMSRREIAAAPVDMTKLAREVYEEVRSAAPAERNIVLNLADLPAASGDPALLRQVWVNLLSNAVKYTGPRPKAVIDVGSSVAGGENSYWVKDNGVGFDMRYVDKLFGVFRRLHADSEFEGTGIGLAIVKRIVTRHGGRVWAESKPGEGTTLYFTLAATKEK
jgi:PAS domain S-box-containing protein